MALLGTTTCAELPEGSTVVGRTISSPRAPLMSIILNTMSVLASKPLPKMVIVWPGVAEAFSASAAAPAGALAVHPVKVRPKALLVPPGVVTRIGPEATSLGTVNVMPAFGMKLVGYGL